MATYKWVITLGGMTPTFMRGFNKD